MASTHKEWFFKEYRDIFETTGETVLTYITRCGMDRKSSTVSLEKYLKNLSQESTVNFNIRAMKKMKEKSRDSKPLDEIRNGLLRNLFNTTELEQLENDPSCSNCDISLLYKIIRYACENVSDEDKKWSTPSSEMEYFISKIKKKRNNVVHKKVPKILNDEKFNEEVETLTELLMETLEATRIRYERNEDEITSKKDEVLKAISDTRKEVQQRAANAELPNFKKETNNELQNHLNHAKYIDPLHFLSGHENNKVDVQTLFSRIDVVNEGNDGLLREKDINHVDYLTILEITKARSPLSCPQILLVEGDAGSGKTTLITFIVSEWLIDEGDRCMKGLDHYDLLLRVVCREENISTLDELLKQVLPSSYIKYGSYLVPLLKKCKVLFLVDGLDEMNEISDKLVKNILSEGKECGNFTFMCTSRPDSVLGFKCKTPKNYQTSKVRLFGISHEERTHFVLKHYEWLAGDVSDDTDHLKKREEGISYLKQIMKEIGWMELFRLPLNLLFLAAVFYYDPTLVTANLTQSQLYNFIHMWCKEKLLHRLCLTLSESKFIIQKKVDTVLKVVYKVALKGLLENRIYLTGDDEELLSSCCNIQDLPRSEVIPAFYSMRRKTAYGVLKEEYFIPHKGFQEFFAAQHIIEQSHAYKKGDIRCILQNNMTGHERGFEPLRNMLCHLLWQLNQLSLPNKTMVLEEAVDLIKESGIKYSSEWLSVLADMVPHDATLQRIVFHIKDRFDNKNSSDYKEIIEITDSTAQAALSLLPHIFPCTVMITLERSSDVNLRNAIAQHKLVHLWHHFTHPNTAGTSNYLLQQLAPMNNLENFKGNLDAEHLTLLPRNLKELSLVITGNDHCSSLLPTLLQVRPSLLQLSNLKNRSACYGCKAALEGNLAVAVLTTWPARRGTAGVITYIDSDQLCLIKICLLLFFVFFL
ncbi:uncharacterized protein LOC123512171 isoform X2 [Portunus trituberculatus]|uniref:uncharacterized protein LOC123512171 isoform X2 n=1 Tax=Portunus trituberculatus TaxID=210409 RepID=UPI001E1D1CAE|nr:uncharacterized protein LOC123512171 isoform X2 [Portunus trituberculatus]